MEDVVYFTSDLAVTKDHILWDLSSGSPVRIMENVVCAVNGEQGILALDWNGGLWMLNLKADSSVDAERLCDNIWIPESWNVQMESFNI